MRATATDVKKVATRPKSSSRPNQNELCAMVRVLSGEPEGPVFSVFIGYFRDKLHHFLLRVHFLFRQSQMISLAVPFADCQSVRDGGRYKCP